MTDLPAAAITAAQEALRETFGPHYRYDESPWLDVALKAAAPHITAAAAAAERQRSKAAQDQAVADALEAERVRLREPVAILTDWLEHLPQRHVPLRAAEALLRLRNLTAGADGGPGEIIGYKIAGKMHHPADVMVVRRAQS